ncbi:MAG: tRNA uridine-5-carboxymethylaminomethyl(34) synthesis GTPase MnmE [candidate division WOR-3 bacterium]
MNDTIVACATPAGYSSIAVIRISGDEAINFLRKIFVSSQNISVFLTGHLYYGKIINPSNQDIIDYVLAAVFFAPNSYTGENVVEISCHGNPMIVECIIKIILTLGARIAQPGEFTKRAFLNNRIDLIQAEAVLDTVYANCDTIRRLAIYQLEGKLSEFIDRIKTAITTFLTRIEANIDFPEEEETAFDINEFKNSMIGIQGKIVNLLKGAEQGVKLKQGYKVVIAGRTNVGKSTLFNRLLGYDRAIVHETPGTTRDYLEETVEIEGILVRLIDTAGILLDADGPDNIASKRTEELLENADLILQVFDGAEAMNEQDAYLYNLMKDLNKIYIINKIDLNIALKESEILGDAIKISAKNGENIDMLKRAIKERVFPKMPEENILITRTRQIEALKALHKCLSNALESQTLETIAYELHNALDIIGELTGKVFREDILNKIFDEFCIGK